MSIEGVSDSVASFSSVGVGISAPSSPGISMGSEFSSFSSFSSFETSGLSGGSFNSNINPFSPDTSFVKTSISSVFYDGLADINLDPAADVTEISEITEVPQNIQNAFPENFVEDILTNPPSYSPSESILKPTRISEPEIGQAEANCLEQVASSLEPEIVNNEPEFTDYQLPTTAEINSLDQELVNVEALIEEIQAQTSVIPSETEKLVEEVQEILTQTSVIPASEPESKSDSSQASLISNILQDLHVQDGSRIQSGMTVNDEEISEPVLVEAVSELEKLAEAPITITLPEASAEVAIVPEVAQIIQTNPETIQAVETYKAFVTAGIEETQAMELVENALMQIGTKAEVVEQIMVWVQTKQQVKTEQQVKPAQAEAKVSTQTIKVEDKIEKVEDDEEEKKKKKRLKFIIDKNALANIFKAWKKAVESAPVNVELGKDVIDISDALALMPTEVQNSGVISGILPKYILEWLNFGDGAYRTALSMAKDIGLRSKQVILEKVFSLHQKYYPVTVAENGEEAAKSNVELVLTYKPNPIRN